MCPVSFCIEQYYINVQPFPPTSMGELYTGTKNALEVKQTFCCSWQNFGSKACATQKLILQPSWRAI